MVIQVRKKTSVISQWPLCPAGCVQAFQNLHSTYDLTAQHSTAQRSTKCAMKHHEPSYLHPILFTLVLTGPQHSTAQHSTAQHSTAQRSTLDCNCLWHSTACKVSSSFCDCAVRWTVHVFRHNLKTTKFGHSRSNVVTNTTWSHLISV